MLNLLKSIRLSFTLLAVVILLIFLRYSGIIKPIENLVIWILSPIQHQVYSSGTKINSVYSDISSQENLRQINDQLAEEVRQLTVENADLETKLHETQELLEQYNFLTAGGLEAIPAKIIGRNPESNRQTVILDQGAKKGVQVGLAIITADGIIVGKISRVKTNSSEAILVNDFKSRLAALIQNQDKTKGVVMGEHSLSLKMELIPQNEVVKPGDVVVTSGFESAVPRGLVIGKINRVETDPNSFFQTAWLQSLVKLNNLTVVSILKGPSYD